MMTTLESVAAVGAVLGTLLVAHSFADHWVQTDHQAAQKGLPGWPGRLACATHVLSYVLTAVVFLAALQVVTGPFISWTGLLVGQLVNGVSHYWADRRFTLAALCERLGKGNFYRLGAPRAVRAYTEIGSEPVALRQRDWPATFGKPVSWDNPSLGTGAYALDQSWHHAWIFIATLVTVWLS